jgi:deoxyribose-phosphate aldolase
MSSPMALRLEELAKTIDHSLLDPVATLQDVERLCEEARKHHFASVCVLPFCVPRAAEALRGCDVKVCTVVSYPFGADATKAKVAAAEHCVAAGADELDVVLNVPALLSGEARYVRDELAALVRAVRVKSVNMGKGIVLLKVIVECGHLEDKLKKLACKIVEDAGADFVETSTGWTDASATLYDVELLRDMLPESIGVKASGGIDTSEEAEAMIAAGAGRIGTANAVAILADFAKLRRAS